MQGYSNGWSNWSSSLVWQPDNWSNTPPPMWNAASNTNTMQPVNTSPTSQRLELEEEPNMDEFIQVFCSTQWIVNEEASNTSPDLNNQKMKKNIEGELSGQSLYKTELCHSFEETGYCRYGSKCQFAHGGAELRPVVRHPKYKTEICKTFYSHGTCPYGKRCRFIHTQKMAPTNASTQQQFVQVSGFSNSWSAPGAPAPSSKIAYEVEEFSKSGSYPNSRPVVAEETLPTPPLPNGKWMNSFSSTTPVPTVQDKFIQDADTSPKRLSFFQSISSSRW